MEHVFSSMGSFPQLVNVSQLLSDDTLEREFLLHFFREDDSIDGFVKYLRDVYLKPLLGEAKLVNGIGDPENGFPARNLSDPEPERPDRYRLSSK